MAVRLRDDQKLMIDFLLEKGCTRTDIMNVVLSLGRLLLTNNGAEVAVTIYNYKKDENTNSD